MKILHVDLTAKTVSEEKVADDLLELYIGGRGLGARLLFDAIPTGIDPLGAENPLIFLAGPLTGSVVPTSGRLSLTTKSPLTGTIFDANAGGRFGAFLRRLGLFGLIITGKADRPVYLSVKDGGAAIEEAGELWGMDVHSTVERLKLEGARSVAAIGPAGERLVRFASIVIDGGRAFGRGGVGAVMGSKNLKAVALEKGANKTVDVGHNGFDFFVHEARKLISTHPITSQALPEFGTAMLVRIVNRAGAFPSRNFTTATFDGADSISGEAISNKLLKRKSACYGCPIACGRHTRTPRAEGEGPEYETVWALGANLGISDIELIAEANYLCNSLGLDTISTGAVIATAMELAEMGSAGFPLRFGDGEGLLEAIEKIALRDGYGAELAEGAQRLADSYGIPQAAVQVKGQELPAYDPRALRGQALALGTSNRGGCHLRANMLGYELLGAPKMIPKAATRGKAGLVIVLQHLFAVLDSLIMCKFSAFALNEEHYARLLSSATGREVESQELLLIGERIWNLERLFNAAEGFSREDDYLPERVRPEGYEEMLEEYYRFRGWSDSGLPSEDKLTRLGLEQEGRRVQGV